VRCNMSSTRELLKKIKETRELSQQELLSFPLSIRAGMEGQIRSAQNLLPVLEKEYTDEIAKNVFAIPLIGENAQEFAELASNEFGVFSINYYSLPDATAKNVIDRRIGDVYSPSAYNASIDDIYAIRRLYGIQRLPYMLQLSADWYGHPLKEAMREQFTKAYGNELYTIAIRNEASRYALSVEFDGNRLPVIIYNFDSDLGLNENLFPNPRPINIGKKKITKEFVSETLTKIKNKATTESNIEE